MQKGIYATGTIRADRTAKCPLLDEYELKELGRGSMDSAIDTKNDLACVRWFDNKAITILSAYSSYIPVTNCKRWSKQENRQIEIPRPAVVGLYNESMGGVDLFGMLVAIYRVRVKSKTGYMRIIHGCISVAGVNGWLCIGAT